MRYLVEDPTVILVVGVLLLAGLAIALLRTGRGVLMLVMALVATLMVIGLGVERYVVTEREEVEDTLDGIARALRANDREAVFGYLAMDASEIRRAAEANLSRVTITEAKIRNFDVRFNNLMNPPTARATFLGIITAKEQTGSMPYDHFMQRFSVDLRRDGTGWVLTGYQEQPTPERGPLQ